MVKLESSISLQNVSEYVKNGYFFNRKECNVYWNIFRRAYLCRKRFILILIIGILIVTIVIVPTVVLQMKKAKNKLITATTTSTQSTEEKEFGKE